jgi:hypothetical protein
MRSTRRIVLVLATAVMVPAVLGAQDRLTQPDSIPAALVSALMTSSGFTPGSEPLMQVGSIPAWAAQRVPLPSGWRVIGSAYMGTIVIGVVEAPTMPDSAIKRLEQTLLAATWKPTPPPYMGPMMGGFRPAGMLPNTTALNTRRFTLCSENQTLSAWIARDRALSTTVVFRLGTAGTPSVCNPPPRDTASERMIRSQRPPFPTLYDPSTSRDPNAMRECYEYGGGMSSTQTRFKTTMSGEKVLEHYGAQLRDSGWVAGGPTSRSAAMAWSRPDSAGKPMHVVLSVVTASQDTTCKVVNMEIQRARP